MWGMAGYVSYDKLWERMKQDREEAKMKEMKDMLEKLIGQLQTEDKDSYIECNCDDKDAAPVLKDIGFDDDVEFHVGKYVVVRCESMGVHVGFLSAYDADTGHANLKHTRRLYQWEGAFTVSSIAAKGITGGKLTEENDIITLSKVGEIHPCTKDAYLNLRKFPAHKI